MSLKSRGIGGEVSPRSMVSKKWTFLLCLGSFCAGLLFTNRMWTMPEPKDIIRRTGTEEIKMNLVSSDCNIKSIKKQESNDIIGEVSKTHHAIQTLDKTISNLEMELAAAKAAQESILNGSPSSETAKPTESLKKRKYLMVVGINTAFSSRKRRDSVRATWMPQGEKRKKLDEEKGIVIRFVIGHSATSGGILDKAIEAEDMKHGDFMRLDHVEGYLELSAKTKAYFVTAVSMWDAEFYVKVDDDIHVNIEFRRLQAAGRAPAVVEEELLPSHPSLLLVSLLLQSPFVKNEGSIYKFSGVAWLVNRAKAKWLTNKKEYLDFLHAKIRAQRNCNILKDITIPLGHFTNTKDIADAIVNHFSELFNYPKPPNANCSYFPPGKKVPSLQII
ncbi:hypothetical protein KFK09_015904 [Dendrobium nobile]|uniref:Hexosyltransferase n=1 Tax=Dendrobium nobile TaxID=94219 RepID=A0A8T3B5U4_DENNO|nr:hypothetical protein KFK09_015904 [Dendrobium nobile]